MVNAQSLIIASYDIVRNDIDFFRYVSESVCLWRVVIVIRSVVIRGVVIVTRGVVTRGVVIVTRGVVTRELAISSGAVMVGVVILKLVATLATSSHM